MQMLRFVVIKVCVVGHDVFGLERMAESWFRLFGFG